MFLEAFTHTLADNLPLAQSPLSHLTFPGYHWVKTVMALLLPPNLHLFLKSSQEQQPKNLPTCFKEMVMTFPPQAHHIALSKALVNQVGLGTWSQVSD